MSKRGHTKRKTKICATYGDLTFGDLFTLEGRKGLFVFKRYLKTQQGEYIEAVDASNHTRRTFYAGGELLRYRKIPRVVN